MNQMQMICLDDLVPQNHPYRKLKKLLNFDRIIKKLKLKTADTGALGYGKERLVLCLMLQFMENLSDRECERFLQENNAGKWFADFDLTDPTPDYSTLCRFRNELGCTKIELLFKAVQTQLSEKGYFIDSFKFVDATALISRFSLWEQRDEAIKAGYDKLNNENVERFAADKDAKIGAKTANKYWYGFKKHVCVNMKSGMIEKSRCYACKRDRRGRRGADTAKERCYLRGQGLCRSDWRNQAPFSCAESDFARQYG